MSNLFMEPSASMNLKYYASSFQDKQREAKQKERERRNTIAEYEIFKIKRNPWIVFTANRNTSYAKNLGTRMNDSNDNYLVDVLNLDHLLSLKGIRATYLKPVRLFLAFNRDDYNVEESNLTSSCTVRIFSIIQYVIKFAKSLKENSYSFFHRFVGLYYFFSLKKNVQKLLVPLKDISSIKSMKKKQLPVVYFLKSQSPFDIALMICISYWNGLRIPTIFVNKKIELRLPWILQKLAVTVVSYDNFEMENNVKKLLLENSLKSKKDVVLYLGPSKNEFIYDTNFFVSLLERIVRNSTVPDIAISVVNFNYEYLPVEFLEKKLLFQTNEKRLSSVPNSYSSFKFNFGFVRSKFGELISLKERNVEINDENVDKRFQNDFSINNVEDISTRLILDLSETEILMSTNLISFLLLGMYRDGVNYEKLVKDVEELRQELMRSKKSLGFMGSSRNIIEHAIKLMSSELKISRSNEDKFIKPVLQLPEVLQLSRLSKVAINYFILDAVMMNCIAVIFKSKLDNVFNCQEKEFTFYYSEFTEKMKKLCDILQTEWIFERPGVPLYEEINKNFFKYEELEYFVKEEKFQTEEERWGHRYAKQLESEDEDDYDDCRYFGDVYWINFNAEPFLYKKITHYKALLQPIIDTYVVCAEHMKTLINRPILYTELVKELFSKLEFCYNNQQLDFVESVSLDLVENCIRLFEKWTILESFVLDGLKVINLSNNYRCEEDLCDIIYKIKNFQ